MIEAGKKMPLPLPKPAIPDETKKGDDKAKPEAKADPSKKASTRTQARPARTQIRPRS